MEIPVLLEPTPTGFRASTGAPLNLTAEATTAEAAIQELRRQFVHRQVAGARVVPLSLPEPDPLFEHAARLGANPFMSEWAEAVKEARGRREAEEEAEATASQESTDRNGHATPSPIGTEPAT